MSFNDLNDTFNVDGEIVPSTDRKLKKITSQVDDIKKDYEYTRGNLYSIIEKGQEALNGVLELAQDEASIVRERLVGIAHGPLAPAHERRA